MSPTRGAFPTGRWWSERCPTPLPATAACDSALTHTISLPRCAWHRLSIPALAPTWLAQWMATIDIDLPPDTANKVAFVSAVENLTVNPGSAPARVIVNSRSGTVVIGSEVRVMPAAVAHGNLTVSISENIQVSQPGPFARAGETAVTPQSEVAIDQEGGRMFLIDPGITLKDLVDAVNRVGAAPGDLVAILEALERAGALRAELTVI